MPGLKLSWPTTETGCTRVLCFDSSVLDIVGGLLERLEWRASYETDEGWTAGRAWALERQEEIAMGGCLEEILTEVRYLRAIMDALSTGRQFLDEPALDYNRGVGDPPGGAETWEEWEIAYCDQSAAMYDMIHDFFSDLYDIVQTGVELSLAVGVALLVTGPISPLVMFIVAALEAGVEFACGVALDCIEEREVDIICALYAAGSPESARAALESILSSCDPAGDWVFGLFSQELVNAAWNLEIPEVGVYDCSVCAHCEGVLTFDSGGDLAYEIVYGELGTPSRSGLALQGEQFPPEGAAYYASLNITELDCTLNQVRFWVYYSPGNALEQIGLWVQAFAGETSMAYDYQTPAIPGEWFEHVVDFPALPGITRILVDVSFGRTGVFPWYICVDDYAIQ